MKVKSQLLDAQLESRAGTPTTAKRGEVVINTSASNQVQYSDGSSTRTVANLDQAQTFSSKTLTSPVINTGVSGTAILDEDNMASDSATHLATQQSIKAYVDTHAADTSTHGVGVILGSTETQNISGKTFTDALHLTEIATPSNPSAGLKKLYPKTDGKLYTLDSAGNETEVGSGGGGSGSKNYIDSISANIDNTVGDWLTDDGSGGVADYLTLSIEGTVHLAGTGSLVLVKSANNATGEFIKVNTQMIDLADRGKPLFGSFSYDATHANYASGDVIVEVYDVTNAAVLYSGQSADLQILKTKGRFDFVTYTEATTAVIQLRLKVNSTNAATYNMLLDEFKLGPAANVSVPIITEWQSFNPTGLWTTNTTYVGRYRRVGDSMEMFVHATLAGAPNSANFTVNIPFGLTIDLNKIASASFNIGDDNLGQAYIADATPSTGRTMGQVYAASSTAISLLSIASGTVNQAAPFTFAINDDIRIFATIPISEWSAGTTMTSNELSLQTVRVSGAGNGGGVVTTSVNVDWTEVEDSHGAWNGTQFTAPKTDYYVAHGSFRLTGAATIGLSSYIDGTLSKSACTIVNAAYFSFYWEGELAKGQVLSFRPTSGSNTLSNSTTLHWIEISNKPNYTVLGAVKERNRVQTKYVAADTTDGDLSELTCSNLVIGKWYEVTGQMYMATDVGASNTSVTLTATHDSAVVSYNILAITESVDTSVDAVTVALAFKFKATATTLTFSAGSASASSYIAGDGTKAESYIQIEERNDLIETTAF
jgi:hypothetical protein